VTARRRTPNVLRSPTPWAYILTRFGLAQVGTVEERRNVIIVEPWSDVKLWELR
jgi:hypothetical protein